MLTSRRFVLNNTPVPSRTLALQNSCILPVLLSLRSVPTGSATHLVPRMMFSTRVILRTPTNFLKRLKRLILKRIIVFRLLFYGTLIVGVSTFITATKDQKQGGTLVTPSFFLLHSTEAGQRFKLSGVIKGGSI